MDPAERCANCGQPFDNEDIKRLSFIKFREAYCTACYQQKKGEFAATGKHPTSYGTTSLGAGWAGDAKTHTPKDHQFVSDFRGNCTFCGGREFTIPHDNWRQQHNPPVPAHGQTFWAAHALTRKPKPPSRGGSLHRFVSDPDMAGYCGKCGRHGVGAQHPRNPHKFLAHDLDADICAKCGDRDASNIHNRYRPPPEPVLPDFALAAARFTNGEISWEEYQAALESAGVISSSGFATSTPVQLSSCPGCGATLPEDDLQAQRAHMEEYHQDIVAERLAENRRWDGWEQDG